MTSLKPCRPCASGGGSWARPVNGYILRRMDTQTRATRCLFGTDGIRGTANTDPMTAEMALRLGQAAGLLFTRGSHRHVVLIGKDTRLSGYMIRAGADCRLHRSGDGRDPGGSLPTPAIAMLTRSLRADLGVMISASHNPYEDNGIKLFGPDGFKLSDETEIEIERYDGENGSCRPACSTAGAGPGRAADRRRRPLYRKRKVDVSARAPAGWAEDRRRLRQRRPLIAWHRRCCGSLVPR